MLKQRIQALLRVLNVGIYEKENEITMSLSSLSVHGSGERTTIYVSYQSTVLYAYTEEEI